MGDLYAEVERRLGDDEGDADPTARRLALAALLGDDELAAAIAGDEAPPPEPTASDSELRGVFLGAVRVAGFRGIGAAAELPLTPAPGLTLVVGRNGSGKSSFAEAIELAFTGQNARWEKRSAVWKDGWRNLHDGGEPSIDVELTIEGEGARRQLQTRWPHDAMLDDARSEVARPGSSVPLERVGWADAGETFRPFLPYSELGALVDDGPTKLHDALSGVLGLGTIAGATKRLKDRRLADNRAWKDVLAAGRSLADELDALDDPRASVVATQLRAKRPDLATVGSVFDDQGTGAAHRGLDELRALGNLHAPDLAELRGAAQRLREASAAAEALRGTTPARDLDTAGLLEAAVELHEGHEIASCPVCGSGQLDATWREQAKERVRRLRGDAEEAQRTLQARDAARRRVEQLVTPVPAVATTADVVSGIEITGLRRAYEAWLAVPRHDEDTAAADALVEAGEHLATAVTATVGAAREEHARRQDAWLPFVTRIGAWLERARPADDAAAVVPKLQEAEKALNGVLEQIRTDRWGPIAEQAKSIWETLRQRSNVAIEDVALAGAGVRRRVDVSVSVDGVAGAALSVMSQGELHGLALSLFLPRATLPESPFRFLVIDDPVQSMDPARVDGLALVLQEIAGDRQVVVFTHDDRLPEAVRRLGIEANVIEVSRSPGSRVHARRIGSPAQRHLDDARALARSEQIPGLVRDRAVPNFLRLALEAACADVVRAREIARGRPHDEVNRELERADKLVPLLALTLLSDADRAGDVYAHLNRWGGWAVDAVKACNKGSHGAGSDDLPRLVKDVEDLVRRIAA